MQIVKKNATEIGPQIVMSDSTLFDINLHFLFHAQKRTSTSVPGGGLDIHIFPENGGQQHDVDAAEQPTDYADDKVVQEKSEIKAQVGLDGGGCGGPNPEAVPDDGRKCYRRSWLPWPGIYRRRAASWAAT